MPRVPITDDIRKKLQLFNIETGVGTWTLLGGRKDIPDGLDSGIIASWLHSGCQTARKEHLDYVLSVWREVDPIIPITPDMQAKYRFEMARTDLTPTKFMRVFGGGSSGVTKVLLDKISGGRRNTIQQIQWDHIMTSLSSRDDSQN